MRLVALFAALAVLSAFVALASFGAGVQEHNATPWWAYPGFFGGAGLTLIFSMAAVIRLIDMLVRRLRGHRQR